MSAEIVDGPGGLYVITGGPQDGYHIRPVGQPIATYERKFKAREAVRLDQVKQPTCESCGQPGEVRLDDGSWWCSPCDGAAERLGYDDDEVTA